MATFLSRVNPKIVALFTKRAGDRYDELLELAEEFHDACAMSPERALAEALHARPRKKVVEVPDSVKEFVDARYKGESNEN